MFTKMNAGQPNKPGQTSTPIQAPKPSIPGQTPAKPGHTGGPGTAQRPQK